MEGEWGHLQGRKTEVLAKHWPLDENPTKRYGSPLLPEINTVRMHRTLHDLNVTVEHDLGEKVHKRIVHVPVRAGLRSARDSRPAGSWDLRQVELGCTPDCPPQRGFEDSSGASQERLEILAGNLEVSGDFPQKAADDPSSGIDRYPARRVDD